MGITLTKSQQESSHAKNRNINSTLVVESCGINYTGKYNLLHNNHVNKYNSVNTKKET